jgi:uncharacterized repeat protein (TIGR03803 family)
MDSSGNLYGTTYAGGAHDLGTVFEVSPGGVESVLHSFDGSDGAYPAASLVMDDSGNLYGTTYEGGVSTNCSGGCGAIFELAGGVETVIHSFSGVDGAFPAAPLIRETNGNMYGTAEGGGANSVGEVFEFSNKGKLVVLNSFGARSGDGVYPASPVVKKSGYLYGTTSGGGASGNGTVFKTPGKPGSDTVLYSFSGGGDGATPVGGLLYKGGSFFGTAYAGADAGCNSDAGCGTVFEVRP